jgi:hypothetical protein
MSNCEKAFQKNKIKKSSNEEFIYRDKKLRGFLQYILSFKDILGFKQITKSPGIFNGITILEL